VSSVTVKKDKVIRFNVKPYKLVLLVVILVDPLPQNDLAVAVFFLFFIILQKLMVFNYPR